MPITRLSPADFLRRKPFKEVLTPRYIPVHPKVFESDLPYSTIFLGEVVKSLPGYIDEDMTAITEILGISTKGYRGRMCPKYTVLSYVANQRSLDVFLIHANIALDANQKGSHRCQLDAYHPMSPEKMREYLDEEGFALTWYTHNVSDFGLETEVLFRSIAIAVNNMALDRLGL